MPNNDHIELLVSACEDDIREADGLIAQAVRNNNPVEWARGIRDLADATLRAQQCQNLVQGQQPQQRQMLPWDNPAWHNLEPEQKEGVAKQMLTPQQLEAAEISKVDPVTYAKNLAKMLEAKSKGDYPDGQRK